MRSDMVEIGMRECDERLAGMSKRGGAVVVSRATLGLAGVLRALGLEKGSGVLVPVMCCANVVHAVRGAGLREVFVDMQVERFVLGMDLVKAERVVREDGGVRAVLAVPLFGGEMDWKGIRRLAQRERLLVVEDRAQLGMRNVEFGMRNDVWAVASVYSFGVGKVGDAGGGGAVVSDDLGLLERVKRELEGRSTGVSEERVGRIMGALDRLEEEVEGRMGLAARLREGLRMEGVEHFGGELPSWKYSVMVRDREERDRVTRRLLSREVEASNLYMPLSRWFGCYDVEGRMEFGLAWGVWERIVNVPLWPVREGMVEDVVWAFGEGE
jgi:dTDP-4-amino-4,6-dideoxygalactose transaminase